MKHILISLIVLLAIAGAYIGYEAMSVQKAYSPSNPEVSETEIEEETRDFGADGEEDDAATIQKLQEQSARDEAQKKSVVQPTVQTNTQTSAKTYTLAEIAKHPNASSCYTAVRGTVYDLTNFITEHPGGAANILKICGKDGTSAFTKKHAGRPEPEQELAGHEIGKLAK
jgi:cytochrome b involved in lipid metabolism